MKKTACPIRIAIAEDMELALGEYAKYINGFPGFEVVIQARNGLELVEKIAVAPIHPDIIVMDIRMPVMDGIQATSIISAQHPSIKIVAFTFLDKESSTMDMFRAGACAYLVKGMHLQQLQKALLAIHKNGKYKADIYHLNSINLLHHKIDFDEQLDIKEKTLLQLTALQVHYRDIATLLHLQYHEYENLQTMVRQKLNVKDRPGLVAEGLRLDVLQEEELKYAQYLTVQQEDKWLNVPVSQIIYIQSSGNYCKVFISGVRYRIISLGINKLLELLDPDHFCQNHRQLIVALCQIQFLARQRTFIELKQLDAQGKPVILPVSRTYLPMLLAKLPGSKRK